MGLNLIVHEEGKQPKTYEADEITLMFFDTLINFLSNLSENGCEYFMYYDDEDEPIFVRTDDELSTFLSTIEGDATKIWLIFHPVIENLESNKKGDDDMDFEQTSYISPDELQFMEVISQGQFGSVYRALNIRDDQIVAVKSISVDDSKDAILDEIEILKPVHRRVHHCDYRCQSAIDMYRIYGWFVYRYGQLPGEVLAPVTVAVINGLYYLWSRNVMHRDIKPSNFLANTRGEIKISDFGVSKRMQHSIARSYVGTNAYMAPERILGSEYNLKYNPNDRITPTSLLLSEYVKSNTPMNKGIVAQFIQSFLASR